MESSHHSSLFTHSTLQSCHFKTSPDGGRGMKKPNSYQVMRVIHRSEQNGPFFSSVPVWKVKWIQQYVSITESKYLTFTTTSLFCLLLFLTQPFTVAFMFTNEHSGKSAFHEKQTIMSPAN